MSNTISISDDIRVVKHYGCHRWSSYQISYA